MASFVSRCADHATSRSAFCLADVLTLAIAIPLFAVFRSLGLLNSYWGLILGYQLSSCRS
jgi:ABC-type glycerol-3-phosphate transport system permease component